MLSEAVLVYGNTAALTTDIQHMIVVLTRLVLLRPSNFAMSGVDEEMYGGWRREAQMGGCGKGRMTARGGCGDDCLRHMYVEKWVTAALCLYLPNHVQTRSQE